VVFAQDWEGKSCSTVSFRLKIIGRQKFLELNAPLKKVRRNVLHRNLTSYGEFIASCRPRDWEKKGRPRGGDQDVLELCKTEKSLGDQGRTSFLSKGGLLP